MTGIEQTVLGIGGQILISPASSYSESCDTDFGPGNKREQTHSFCATFVFAIFFALANILRGFTVQKKKLEGRSVYGAQQSFRL